MLRDFSKEAFDIIIQAGQSNAEGCGLGPAGNPYAPNDTVFYLNSDMSITQATEAVHGNYICSNFSLSFAREYLQGGHLAAGRKLLILRAAVGGTGFLDNRWGMTDDLYLQMMEMIRTALALNSENRLVALLWHQGETDAILFATHDQHYQNLSGLIQSVRDTFSVPDLPFIAGDFVSDWKMKNMEICGPVVDAIRAVCRDCAPGGFVETADLPSNNQESYPKPADFNDDIHFSRQSIYQLGIRYYECWKQLVST